MGGRSTRHRPSPPCGPARAETPAFFKCTSDLHTTHHLIHYIDTTTCNSRSWVPVAEEAEHL